MTVKDARPTVQDARIARAAKQLAKYDAEMHEKQRELREARAKRDGALVRLAHLTEEPAK